MVKGSKLEVEQPVSSFAATEPVCDGANGRVHLEHHTPPFSPWPLKTGKSLLPLEVLLQAVGCIVKAILVRSCKIPPGSHWYDQKSVQPAAWA